MLLLRSSVVASELGENCSHVGVYTYPVTVRSNVYVDSKQCGCNNDFTDQVK